eukprot:PhM_4_TR703/c0_g1_i1/m.52230
MRRYDLHRLYATGRALAENASAPRKDLTQYLRDFAANASHRESNKVVICSSSSSSSSKTKNDTTLNVWLSTFPWEVKQGLNTYPRTALAGGTTAPARGMLFVHPTAQRATYWMYRVQYDLDLAFFGSDGRLLRTDYLSLDEPDKTATCDDTRYVLEMVREGFTALIRGDDVVGATPTTDGTCHRLMLPQETHDVLMLRNKIDTEVLGPIYDKVTRSDPKGSQALMRALGFVS